MSYLETYWETASSANSYWGECRHEGHRLVLAAFGWPPKEVASGQAQQTRYIVFFFDGSEAAPNRSISYEPGNTGPGFFLAEAHSGELRLNHGKVDQMTIEQFWDVALVKLFGSSPTPTLPPPPSQSSKTWWKFWK